MLTIYQHLVYSCSLNFITEVETWVYIFTIRYFVLIILQYTFRSSCEYYFNILPIDRKLKDIKELPGLERRVSQKSGELYSPPDCFIGDDRHFNGVTCDTDGYAFRQCHRLLGQNVNIGGHTASRLPLKVFQLCLLVGTICSASQVLPSCEGVKESSLTIVDTQINLCCWVRVSDM